MDPQLLFQRLIIASSPEELESSLILRKPQKTVLAEAIWSRLSEAARAEPSGAVKYVLDGGALVHRVVWPQETTFKEVCEMYSSYVLRKYGRATIVFDGYDVVSTKSMTQE